MDEYVRMGWFLVPRDLRQDPVRIGWYNPPADMLANGNVRVGWFQSEPALWDVTGAPRITSPASATVTVDTPFSYQIRATRNPTSFNATGLPPGLSVNTTTGLISGTPTAVGTTVVALSATNADGTGTRNLSIRVNAAGPPPPVSLDAYYGPSNEWLIPPNPAALTEAYIKGLTARANPANGTSMAATISAPQGRSPIFAYPATLRPATSIIHEGLGMNVVGTFQQATIQVNGVDYRVYYQEAEFPVGQNTTFTMTI